MTQNLHMVMSNRKQGSPYFNLRIESIHAAAVLSSIQLAPVPACSKSVEN